MIRQTTEMMLRQDLEELLDSIQSSHDQVVITRGGKTVAALPCIYTETSMIWIYDQTSAKAADLARQQSGFSQVVLS